MEVLIITGMSGAGKSQAANALEDMGYYCVDNIPPLIIPSFVELFSCKESGFNKLAIGTDIRGGELFDDIIEVLDTLKDKKIEYKILFLNADNTVLVNRYKENRRRHPLTLAENITVTQAVARERSILDEIYKRADYIIDTTHLSVMQLKQQINGIFSKSHNDVIEIQCVSFGYKYGVPADSDLVFDVRCLPNPFYIDELRSHTGLEKVIQDFVMASADSVGFLERIFSLLDFIIPLYIKEGKTQLIIATGCTGGQHRSVTFAELINKHLSEQNYSSITVHRDITKN